VGMILSAAMMLRYSFQMEEEAAEIERAVNDCLDQGYHTADLSSSGGMKVGTKEMTAAIVDSLTTKSVSNSICSMYV
ncbi:3-isopropylmalate dehydrogenase, partial [Virgibacillus halodenitrificans]|nr:3-isopropylmalate dehydrogenase [Virgibacillus halodenitrificans]